MTQQINNDSRFMIVEQAPLLFNRDGRFRCWNPIEKSYVVLEEWLVDFARCFSGQRGRTITEALNELNKLYHIEMSIGVESCVNLLTACGLIREACTRKINKGLPPSKQPVIVIGSPRSGTTLTSMFLTTHPNIYCAVESQMLDIFSGLVASTVVDCKSNVGHFFTCNGGDPERFVSSLGKLIYTCYSDFSAAHGFTRWSDKSCYLQPHLEVVDRLFDKQAKYLFVARNPLNTLASMVANQIELPDCSGTASDDLHASAKFWSKQQEYVKSFMKQHPERSLLIHYEKMISEPQTTANEIFDFLKEERIASITDLMFKGPPPFFSGGDRRALFDRDGLSTRCNLDKHGITALWPLVAVAAEWLGYKVESF